MTVICSHNGLIIFYCRHCLHKCYVHHNMPHGAHHHLCVAKKHLTGSAISDFLWIHRECLFISCDNKNGPRRLATPRPLLHLHGHHVHLALWDLQEVQL